MMGDQLQVSSDELQRLEELSQALARESFLEFRRRIRPQMAIGWWVREVAQRLQHFYDDFAAGKRPKIPLYFPSTLEA